MGAIPITLVTGAPGAGKTTLIDRILADSDGTRITVIAGETQFGRGGALGGGLAQSPSRGNVHLQPLVGNLIDAVVDAAVSAWSPDHVLIEPDGVADPLSASSALVEAGRHGRIRLDSIICIIDTGRVLGDPGHSDLRELIARQAGLADLVVLNKATSAGVVEVEKVSRWLRARFAGIRLVEADYCDVPTEMLSTQARPHLSDGVGHRLSGHHIPHYETWSFESRTPLNLSALRRAGRSLPLGIYGLTGVVHSEDLPTDRLMFRVVGRRAAVVRLGEWGEEPPTTKLVAFGRRGGTTDAELAAHFSVAYP